jgi:hypothetical protein
MVTHHEDCRAVQPRRGTSGEGVEILASHQPLRSLPELPVTYYDTAERKKVVTPDHIHSCSFERPAVKSTSRVCGRAGVPLALALPIKMCRSDSP